MKSSIIALLSGYVKVEVKGNRIEQLLNRMVQKKYFPWEIKMINESRATFFISVSDFFKLRPLLRETECRIHVMKRYGIPFILDKLLKRKFFAAGIILFVVGTYMLSSVVWSVTVDGNDKLTNEQILMAAKQEGIFPMQWKFRLKDPDELSRSIHTKLPNAAWVGVEIKGTQIRIKVVESQDPEVIPLLNPRNIVASHNALVTSIFVEKGKPMIKPNSYVRKGDVLISGVIGSEENQQVVVAQGLVKGVVWYTSRIDVPLVHTYKTYTGESVNRSYLVIGNRGMQITGYGKLPFTQFETVSQRTMIQWRDFRLPFGWLKEKLMELEELEQPIDQETALQTGLEHARVDVLLGAGKDSKIITEKILHESMENGKVYMETYFEVEQHIMQEQPIIQGQGE